MFFSLWFSIVLAGGQTGCSTLKKETAPANRVAESTQTMRAVVPQGAPSGTVVRGLRNPDYYQIPKVPPPGARNSYSSVNVAGPYIAMTFDDGPHPTNTPRLLDILKERNIKATFFVIGNLAREYPNIIRRILAEGHEIGNHTYTHPILTKVSDDRIRKELTDTHKALVDVAGYHTRIFRPPGGGTNARLKQWFHDEYGYSTIMWSVDPMDWKRPGVSVVTSRLVNGARNGGILLAHDLHAPTITAMPGTLDGLLSKGFRFVTVSQLLNMDQGGSAAAPQPVAQAPAPATAPVMLQTPAPQPAAPTITLPSVSNGLPSEGAPARLQPPGL